MPQRGTLSRFHPSGAEPHFWTSARAARPTFQAPHKTLRWSVLCCCAALALGCNTKKKEPPVEAPLPRGGASVDELSTGIGLARGLDVALVPTSTEWRQLIVLDASRAVLAGDIAGEAIAIRTEDAGKTWRAFRSPAQGWSAWGMGLDGTLVLATGTIEKPKVALPAGQRAPIDSAALLFVAAETNELSAQNPLFAPIEKKPTPRIPIGKGLPAVLSKSRAALLVEEAPRKSGILFGGPAGVEAGPLLQIPPVERLIPTPMGRPPMLLSARGRDFLIRPTPSPDKPLDPPQKVMGISPTPAALTELAQLPACEFGAWSFQRVTQQNRPMILGVSPTRNVVVPLPPTTKKTSRVGCGADRFVVETLDPKEKVESLATCGLEGQCLAPMKPPFRPWPEPHEREIATAGTTQGAIAVLTARARDRWGLYLTQSVDGGKLFELPRVIGEGNSDRGRFELGAVISFGARTLLLISTGVTGTSRRGWYIMVTDDGGTTWAPP
jgi:hypothetical protein